MNESNNNDDIVKAQLGYQVATNMVGILGQEIYSRFNAMLTANSIIVAIIGLIITNKNKLSISLEILFPILGLILCFLWFVFIYNGIYRHRQYRKEAARIEEKYFKKSIRLFRIDYSKDPKLLKYFRFYCTSVLVVCIFGLVHFYILLYLLFNMLSL